MFVGEYLHNVDEKGRVAVPAKFREWLENGAVLTRGTDGCLAFYRMNEWDKLVEKISSLPQSKVEVRNYARLILSGAADVKLDKQGRVNLPKFLVDFANISKKVVFVGVNNRLELWDKEKWDDYRVQIEMQSADLLEQLGEFGI